MIFNLDTTVITPASILTLVLIRLIRDLIGYSKRDYPVKLRHNSHKLTFSKIFPAKAASQSCERNCSESNVRKIVFSKMDIVAENLQ